MPRVLHADELFWRPSNQLGVSNKGEFGAGAGEDADRDGGAGDPEPVAGREREGNEREPVASGPRPSASCR
jgi:hypothetical protein